MEVILQTLIFNSIEDTEKSACKKRVYIANKDKYLIPLYKIFKYVPKDNNNDDNNNDDNNNNDNNNDNNNNNSQVNLSIESI